MPSSLRLRLMTAADLDFADSLRALAGWNQTRSDWQRLLELAPDGCFLAELNGAPAGTATTTCYGNDLAWIGMVLVHPDHRRRGIGSALLQHCLEHLSQRHIACIKLDATPLGKPVYEKLGFQTESPLRRWEAITSRALLMTTDRIRPWANRDCRAIQPLDQQAFGVARPGLLAKLVNDSRQALVHAAATGELIGYGLLREGSRADYLGPVSAATADAGVNLCLALLDSQRSTPNPQPIYWDIPDANSAAINLAQQLGFTPQRSFLRMFLGENKHSGDSLQQFAIAGPEIG